MVLCLIRKWHGSEGSKTNVQKTGGRQFTRTDSRWGEASTAWSSRSDTEDPCYVAGLL